MKSALSILGIIIAVVIFFTFTRPMYDSVQTVQGQISQYNAALDKAQQLQQLKQTLLSKYNSFKPTDLSRLQTMLPTQVDNIGLILDLDTLANQYGMSLENVNITSPNSPGSASAGAPATSVGANAAGYDSLDVQFTVHGTYAQFEQYLNALQTSLRIVDLVQLTVGGGGNQPSSSAGQGRVYTFSVTLQTYWLQ